MTWMYLTGYIVFFGAHLTHALNYHFLILKTAKEESEASRPVKKGEKSDD
jgi:uncharacterized BrkB/YihY/UPF0761 family membrane protein